MVVYVINKECVKFYYFAHYIVQRIIYIWLFMLLIRNVSNFIILLITLFNE